MIDEWIVMLVSIVIICTAAAVSIIIIQNGRTYLDNAEEVLKKNWRVELWNIRYGIRIQFTFPNSMTLGRYSLYAGVKGMDAIPEDTTVSREHLLLYDQGGSLWAWNLSAINPAKINGYRLNEPQRLQTGERIELGNSVFLVTDVRYQ